MDLGGRVAIPTALLAAAAIVTLPATVHATTAASPPDGIEAALAWLGAEPATAVATAAAAVLDGTGDTFRYAVPGSEPATIDAAYGDIVADVATAATIERIGPDRTAEVPCGQTLGGDALVLCQGPVALGGPWWVFVMELAGDMPLAGDGLHHSLAVLVLRQGGTPWEPQGDFLWDTFQGTDLWLTVERTPDQDWSLQATQADDFTPIDTGGFAVLRGSTLTVAVPADVLGYPHPATVAGAGAAGAPSTNGSVVLASTTPSDTPRYGTHQHTHDGTFGQNASDRSVVDSSPDTNTDERRTPDRLTAAGPEIIVIGAAPTPEPEVTTPPSPSPSDTAPDETTSPEPSDEPVPEEASSGPFDDAGAIFTALVIGVAATAGTVAVTRRRRRPAPCSCRCRVTIEAPNVIETCCSGDLTLSTNEVEDTTPREDEGLLDEVPRDPAKLHLDLDMAGDGWDFHDLIVSAQLEGICEGGEVLTDDATYDWTATLTDSGITLRVEVTAPVRCPDGGEHPDVRCADEHEIVFRDGTCRVGVVILRTDWNEISHVDVVVECGAYREIFGYFPEGARTFSATIAGGPGEVVRSRNAEVGTRPTDSGPLTNAVTDRIGEDFSIHHGSSPLRVYWIAPDDCAACEKVRRFWEDLASDPGTYYLLNNNCALNGVASLKAAGLWQHDQGPTVRPGQVETMLDLQQLMGTDGFTILQEVDIR